MDDNNCTMLHNGITYKCSIALALSVIGGKWKPLILWHLQGKVLRFGELKRILETITQKILTQELRELEADGLINRHVYAQIPPKVEYSLTEKGHTVLPILNIISKWGADYCRSINEETKKNTSC